MVKAWCRQGYGWECVLVWHGIVYKFLSGYYSMNSDFILDIESWLKKDFHDKCFMILGKSKEIKFHSNL